MPYLSKEEVDYQSKLSTHKELINLGKVLQKKESSKNQLNTDVTELEKYFNKCKSNDIYVTKKDILEKNNQYTELIKQRHKELENKYSKLEDDFADLKNENKDNIREYEENESKLYLRINKLREMCKYRNKKIKFLYITLFLTNLYSIIINTVGYEKFSQNIVIYSNNIFAVISYFTFIILTVLRYILNIVYNVCLYLIDLIVYLYFNLHYLKYIIIFILTFKGYSYIFK